MRMTREAYAREIWKIVGAVREGRNDIVCPHEGCDKLLRVLVTSVRTGKTLVCPDHGVIYRE